MDRTNMTANASFTLPSQRQQASSSTQNRASSTSAITKNLEQAPMYWGRATFKFKPGYWTSWSRKPRSKKRGEIVVLFGVQDEGLYRNVCSAILDVEKIHYLRITPLWLRGVFAALKLLPTARKWLVEWMLYIQLQVIYYKHGYWEYHGGINALRWWQWTHPFNVGRHPAWTVRMQFRSQRFFSKAVQGAYYWVGRSLFGMKGDHPQYNPRFGQGCLLSEASSTNCDKI